MSTHPEVLWAQRSDAIASEKNIVYLTINLPDIEEDSLEFDLTATNISFKARTRGGQQNYEFKLEFFAEVDPEKSTKRLSSRSLLVTLRKKELKSEFWPRLTKDKLRTPFIKTDFGRWVDEDEQDGKPSLDEDLDPTGGLGGFPGGGFPGGGFPEMDGGDFDLSKLSNKFTSEGGGLAEGGNDDVEQDLDDDGPPPLEDPESAK